MSGGVDSSALWVEVDRITKPTQRRVDREPESADWLAGLADDPTLLVCDVAAYRAATASWGEVPSLWRQAELALQTGREQQEGGGSPLAQRSPADLDLMELLLTIRESMAWQLPGRGITPRDGIPAQIRQLAAHVTTNEPQHVAWWTYRFGQWARMLGTYLRAIDVGPKPVRLRNAPCPVCRTRQVTLETDLGEIVVPPILIDFENGWIRAATCTACSAVWWRGNELGELATLLERSDTPTQAAC
jgi:hypothetical protein